MTALNLGGYLPPGVYTRTINEQQIAALLTSLRLPVFIGVGTEELTQTGIEVVRGSSSSVDNLITAEDVSARFVVDDTDPNNPVLGSVSGAVLTFIVRNLPIVDGTGAGRTTTDPNDLSVTVDGVPVVIASVNGATGRVTLQTYPPAGSEVRCTYFFNRTDTRITDDLSDQVTDGAATMRFVSEATYVVTEGVNDNLIFTVDGVEWDVTIPPASYSAASLKAIIDGLSITGLTVSTEATETGGTRLVFSSAHQIVMGSGTFNAVSGLANGASTNRNTVFTTFQGPIVTGSNGGIATTDPSHVTVLVDGVQVIPTAVDGSARRITLVEAPADGATVLVTYYFNTFQDTYDHLPNTDVTSIIRAGYAEGRSDFADGQDFVLANDHINWGTAVAVESGLSAGTSSQIFGSVQIVPTLVDDYQYLAEVSRYIDTSVLPAVRRQNEFVLGDIPTTGNGRDTPLGIDLHQTITNDRIDLPTNRPDLVSVVGAPTLFEATLATALTSLEVDSSTRRVKTKEYVAPDDLVFATYFYNRISDDTFTLTVVAPGGTGVGSYQVSSALRGGSLLHQVRFGAKGGGLTENVVFPRGFDQLHGIIHTGGGTVGAVNEVVTVTFLSVAATPASYTTGSSDLYLLYAGASDEMAMDVDAAGAFTVDMDSPAVGGVVSDVDYFDAAPNLIADIVAATNDVLELEVTYIDGSGNLQTDTLTVTFTTNLPNPAPADLVTDINAAAVAQWGAGSDIVAVVSSLGRSRLYLRVAQIGTEVQLPGTVWPALNWQFDSKASIRILTSSTAAADIGFPSSKQNVTWAAAPSAVVDPATILGSQAAGLGFTVAATNDTLDLTVNGSPISLTVPSSLYGTYSANAMAGVLNHLMAVELGLTTDVVAADGPVSHLASPSPILTTGGAGIFSAGDVGKSIVVAGSADPLNDGAYTIVGFTNPNNVTLDRAFAGAADVAVPVVTMGMQSFASAAYNTYIRITSVDTTIPSDAVYRNAGSSLSTATGSMNDTLGFSDDFTASAGAVTSEEIVTVLNGTPAFLSIASAHLVDVTGSGTFFSITSHTTGALSSIVFTTSADTAYVTGTGIGIEVGDGDLGNDTAVQGYNVASSLGAGGSGTTDPTAVSGYVGQTYTDPTTGLRMTVLQADDGAYPSGGTFTLEISDVHIADAAVPNWAIPGVEFLVTDTLNTTIGDTATIETFKRTGVEPSIGDVYYVDYNYAKTNFDVNIYSRIRDVIAAYGEIATQNQLTLAASLAFTNGAVFVGLKQVLKQEGLETASTQTFIEAIDELERPLDGNVKPDIITPLTGDLDVIDYLGRHCAIQSGIRHQGERIGIFGVESGVTPGQMQVITSGITNERLWGIYPDSAVVAIIDPAGREREVLIPGYFMAAAFAGSAVSPQYDEATPFERREINGLRRLGRPLTEVEKNQVAVTGATVLEDVDNRVRVRHALTTDLTNDLTKLPTVIQIKDRIHKGARRVLDRFIGTKFQDQRITDVEQALNEYLKQERQAEIIGQFSPASAERDENDPTTLLVTATYTPIFPLLYIVVTFRLRSAL
jgi:hypothetical protein